MMYRGILEAFEKEDNGNQEHRLSAYEAQGPPTLERRSIQPLLQMACGQLYRSWWAWAWLAIYLKDDKSLRGVGKREIRTEKVKLNMS
jgi:hypothetical protein